MYGNIDKTLFNRGCSTAATPLNPALAINRSSNLTFTGDEVWDNRNVGVLIYGGTNHTTFTRGSARLQDGERFQWEEYEFEMHFAPGQTEYHSVN